MIIMSSKQSDPPEKDLQPQASEYTRIPVVRIIHPDETVTRPDAAVQQSEPKPLGEEVKVVTSQGDPEAGTGDHEGDDEPSLSGEGRKTAMFLRVPLALKYGCHTCMQTMKQKYLRHFQRGKKVPVVSGLPSIAVRFSQSDC